MIKDPVKATEFADNVGLTMMVVILIGLVVVGFLWMTAPAPVPGCADQGSLSSDGTEGRFPAT